jgi:xylulokinase
LRLAGGGTLAAGWRQLLADVLGVPLHAVDVPAASGRGAALLGAIACGRLGFEDCAGPLAPPSVLAAAPEASLAALYTERHGRFRQAVAALRGQEGPS